MILMLLEGLDLGCISRARLPAKSRWRLGARHIASEIQNSIMHLKCAEFCCDTLLHRFSVTSKLGSTSLDEHMLVQTPLSCHMMEGQQDMMVERRSSKNLLLRQAPLL